MVGAFMRPCGAPQPDVGSRHGTTGIDGHLGAGLERQAERADMASNYTLEDEVLAKRLAFVAASAALAACSAQPTGLVASKDARLSANVSSAPAKQTYFICPTVSLNNPGGMWVIGMHGAYYVRIPRKGSGTKVFLTVPVKVFSRAQIPAGWGLYKDLPTYPNFEGTAHLLSEGITRWLGGPPGFNEGDMADVVNNGDGTYTVTVVGSMLNPGDIGSSVTIDHPIPLASGAIW